MPLGLKWYCVVPDVCVCPGSGAGGVRGRQGLPLALQPAGDGEGQPAAPLQDAHVARASGEHLTKPGVSDPDS